MLKTIKTEPALITGLVQALIALAVGLGLQLTAGQTGAIEAVTTAVLALIAAAATHPFRVPALAGALTAVGTLLIAFGVPHVSAGLVSGVNAVVVAVMALILRSHVTPKAGGGDEPPVAAPKAATPTPVR